MRPCGVIVDFNETYECERMSQMFLHLLRLHNLEYSENSLCWASSHPLSVTRQLLIHFVHPLCWEHCTRMLSETDRQIEDGKGGQRMSPLLATEFQLKPCFHRDTWSRIPRDFSSVTVAVGKTLVPAVHSQRFLYLRKYS